MSRRNNTVRSMSHQLANHGDYLLRRGRVEIERHMNANRHQRRAAEKLRRKGVPV